MLIIQLRDSNVFRPGVTKAQEQGDRQYGMGVGGGQSHKGLNHMPCIFAFYFLF